MNEMLTSGRLDGELRVLTSYYNSQQYDSRRRNHSLFRSAVAAAGVRCITIECAFGDDPFALPEGADVIQTRAQSVLWQKERLLNEALRSLPATVRYVAWIDADVLFNEPKWVDETIRILDRAPVVQLFDTVIQLPRGHQEFFGQGSIATSFCAAHSASPGCERLGWYSHGHTGYAWAARRDLLDRCGFFDPCLTGSGDHLMAHAFVGDWDSDCIGHMIGHGTPLHEEFAAWAARVAAETKGEVAHVDGTIRHLWHGDAKDRKYHQRSEELKALSFVPARDLRHSSNGCWEWTGANPALEKWSRELFIDRKEDGEQAATTAN